MIIVSRKFAIIWLLALVVIALVFVPVGWGLVFGDWRPGFVVWGGVSIAAVWFITLDSIFKVFVD